MQQLHSYTHISIHFLCMPLFDSQHFSACSQIRAFLDGTIYCMHAYPSCMIINQKSLQRIEQKQIGIAIMSKNQASCKFNYIIIITLRTGLQPDYQLVKMLLVLCVTSMCHHVCPWKQVFYTSSCAWATGLVSGPC